MSFRRHPLFNESLTIFAISVEATGEFKEQLESWKAGAAPQVAADAEGPKRKRRRRRRKKKGGAGAAEPGGEVVEASAESSESGEEDDGETEEVEGAEEVDVE